MVTVNFTTDEDVKPEDSLRLLVSSGTTLPGYRTHSLRTRYPKPPVNNDVVVGCIGPTVLEEIVEVPLTEKETRREGKVIGLKGRLSESGTNPSGN